MHGVLLFDAFEPLVGTADAGRHKLVKVQGALALVLALGLGERQVNVPRGKPSIHEAWRTGNDLGKFATVHAPNTATVGLEGTP